MVRCVIFFYKQKTAYERRMSDWSSDVCSSDLTETGKLLYASLDRGGKKLQMMRWTLGGREQFFDASGEATQKGLMRTPVDGARLTSGFGMRLHPLLGYSRMHKGVDFGAPHGAPILAAARSEEHTSELQSLMRNS